VQVTDRRNFLLGSLAASSLLAADAGKPIRLGFIGIGNRGGYHLTQFIKLPGVKVTALCDIKPDRLDKAATTAAKDDPFTTADYKELLARDDIDAVVIATPCDLHVEMAIAALKAGKNVYCEKPLGITPESIERLVKVAKASDKVFQVGQQMRSYARLGKTIGHIHDGVIGKVIMVKAQRFSSQDLNHEGMSKDWFFNAKRSGDVIVEMSVHNLDVCNWVIGAHPERAAGFGGTLKWIDSPPGRTNMDGYSLTYQYPGNVVLSYEQVFFHPRKMPGGGRGTYVYGTKGAVDLNNSMFYPDASAADTQPKELAPEQKEDRAAHMKAFLATIRGERTTPAGIDIGATGAMTAILGREAIYRKQVTEWSKLAPEL